MHDTRTPPLRQARRETHAQLRDLEEYIDEDRWQKRIVESACDELGRRARPRSARSAARRRADPRRASMYPRSLYTQAARTAVRCNRSDLAIRLLGVEASARLAAGVDVSEIPVHPGSEGRGRASTPHLAIRDQRGVNAPSYPRLTIIAPAGPGAAGPARQ